jgi:hypothetical protein
MLLSSLLLAAVLPAAGADSTPAAAGSPGASAAVYSGRERQLDVQVPRVDAQVEVDGRLAEPAWAEAAVLTGFSQYTPNDGVAADDSTEVLVWYSATAIHFGIRAHEAHRAGGRPAVNATLADRDRIFGDDHVQIFLGTFNDGRQATVLGVNPFGVQADGSIVETGQRRSNTGFDAAVATREEPDLSPDFVYQSKGRVTESGYEVEIRVPFKSLRYQAAPEQTWGINVLRRVQHSGFEDSWAPALRAGASFLAQSGRLAGLTDLRRGLVLDLNPVVTQQTTGAADEGGAWRYDGRRPELGGNVRWGLTNNLTLNGTANPDFSQVEADVQQVTYDPRVALFFPERRPFFLDGIEQFTTPSRLIYTRRVVQPVAAVKLTGKVSGTDVALLSAVDDPATSAAGHNPVFNILRVQRDVGRQSRLGIAYTDKVDGADYNRVASVDGRLVFRTLYSTQFQLAGSRTALGDVRADGPLWNLSVARNGRAFGFTYAVSGIDPDFRALSGLISRHGVVNGTVSHRYTLFGGPGAAVQSLTNELALYGTWDYRRFTRRQDALEKKAHLNLNASLRGGWGAGASVLVETFGFDDALYADYALWRVLERDASGAVVRADTLPFTGTSRLPNLDYVLSLDTPQFKRFAGSAFLIWGRDENFFEWSSADILVATLSGDWRPTEKIRVNAQYQQQQYKRRTDGSTVALRRIPRLKVEYQIARPIFVRVVGQYDAAEQDALRDDSRTGLPILIYDAERGVYARDAVSAISGNSASATSRNGLRADWLFSYQPTPGTVFFAGYGSSLEEPHALRFGRGLRRTSDGFFVKFSYLFRVG